MKSFYNKLGGVVDSIFLFFIKRPYLFTVFISLVLLGFILFFVYEPEVAHAAWLPDHIKDQEWRKHTPMKIQQTFGPVVSCEYYRCSQVWNLTPEGFAVRLQVYFKETVWAIIEWRKEVVDDEKWVEEMVKYAGKQKEFWSLSPKLRGQYLYIIINFKL